ncbi:MAG: HEAT repeat domain-containing protein [Acidobacteriota bacterium]
MINLFFNKALATFMDRYLTQRGMRELFNDEEFFDACHGLSQIVGKREITVLIARMYTEQIIAAKGQSTERDLPRNLPDLMLGSVKNLNDRVQDGKHETRKVIIVAKLVAWECLKRTCRPTAAKRDDVLKALKDEVNAEALLLYLETRLQLIQTTGAGADEIRFTLDPLAEYLAGFYLIEHCGENEVMWQEFLDKAQEQPGAPEKIKGFLLGVRDCCTVKGSEHRVPEKISDELARLAGLDAETIKAAQNKQRIKLWKAALDTPEAADRGTVVMALGQSGSETVPILVEVLVKDPHPQVREFAAIAISRMGPDAKAAVPALIDALKDLAIGVRSWSAQALGMIGPEAKAALPALKELSSDDNQELRSIAERALQQIKAGESALLQ